MTNWRELHDVPFDIWESVIIGAGGPTELASREAWEAARPHSRLVLAASGKECRWGTTENLNKLTNKNVLNLKMPLQDDGTREPGFMAFPTWAAGITAAVNRITSPTYGNGIYVPTVTVRDLVSIFAPASENNVDAYVAFVEDHVAMWEPIETADTGEQPVADLVFGKVPHPAFTNRDVPSSVNTAWNNLGARTIRAICLHRSLGTHLGNDQWFRGGGASSALTDYGVAVEAIDGANLAGVLYRWNDPRGRRSPWANGRVSAPYGDGKAFVDLYGTDGVNRDCTSIEISGYETSPFDAKAKETVAQLIAYWADQYKVRHDTFPIIPAENNRSFVIWHREFTIGTGKLCPWDVVMNATDELIARAKTILKDYQVPEKPTPNPYTDPALPDWFDDVLKADFPENQDFNGTKFLACKKRLQVKKAAVQRATSGAKGAFSGPDLPAKTNVDILGTFKSGGVNYVLAAGNDKIARGARIRMADLDESISISER